MLPWFIVTWSEVKVTQIKTWHITLGKKKKESRSVMSYSLWPHRLYSPWNSPGQNTGVVSLSLLQGIFPTQGSNPGSHCRRILYQLSHKGTPNGWKASYALDIYVTFKERETIFVHSSFLLCFLLQQNSILKYRLL